MTGGRQTWILKEAGINPASFPYDLSGYFICSRSSRA